MTISLCIPRIGDNIDKKFIQDVFDKFSLGEIANIRIVSNDTSRRAFIYFDIWHNAPVLDKLHRESHINIIYSFPHCWSCSLKKNLFHSKN